MMERLTTGVPGLDLILNGGLPVASSILVLGPPGSGKTVLAEQIAFHQAALGRRSLILTTQSEASDKLIRFAEGFAWFDRQRIGREIIMLSLFEDLQGPEPSALLEHIVRETQSTGASLVIMDAIRGLGDALGEERLLRRFLYSLSLQLSLLSVTCLLTGEYGRNDLIHYPEFSSTDGIIALSLDLEGVRQQRALEVVKLRWSDFLGGRHTLQITSDGACSGIPQSSSVPT